MNHVTPATLLCDFYKISHRAQYPDKTEVVYSTWTPRSNKYFPRATSVIAFGAQGMIKKVLIEYFDEHFFQRPVEDVVEEYARYIKHTLFIDNPETAHIEDLHDLQYLPLHIKALPEGTHVPMRVPMLTVQNTDSRFFWLTNYIETLASTEMWLTSTAATIALSYRSILDEYALKTAGATDFVPFQGHDFSMRGMAGIDAAMLSGAGHLLSFVGTDTVPAIAYLERYYNANIEEEMVGTSVNATEHSVMCAGGSDNEFDTYKRLITEVYPTGIISIVSDTWDLFGCLEEIIKPLKPEIMARDGKVVIRPDSGDPVDIICGDLTAEEGSQEYKGVVECLYDIFGGEKNAQGFIELDSHIGAIYGDSITPERCESICRRLANKGFASTNVVFGIGSYTYQYNTRDTFGFAMKSTMVVIDGEEKMIFKDPKTDDGTKKSNIGCVAVQEIDGVLVCKDRLNLDHSEPDLMQTVFLDGRLKVDESLSNIRERIAK